MLLIKSILRAYVGSMQFVAFLLTFFLFMLFDVLWCGQTTFRAMSNPALYANNIMVSILLTLPYVLFPKRWIQGAVMLLVSVQMAAVLMYCQTYFRAIPFESYFFASNLADFMPSVAQSFNPRYLNLLWPLLLFLFWRRSGARRRKALLSEIRLGYALSLVTALLLASVVMLCQGGFYQPYSKMKSACYYTTCTTPVYAIYGDLIYEKNKTSSKLSQADREMVDRWLATHRESTPLLPLDSIGSRQSIVVILCESLETWPIGKTVEGHELTPYINSLVSDTCSTMFVPNVVTQVGSGRSIDFQLLFNAGMLPMENEVYSMTYPDRTYLTLNQALAEKNGALSMLLTCDKPVTWNQAPIADAFKIDTLLDKNSWRNDEMVGNPPKLSDGAFMKQIVEKFTEGDLWPAGEPRFVQIVTYSGHSPFKLPESMRTFHFSDSVPEVMADYMTMANYTDQSLKILIEYLKGRSDYNDMMIVITGDHEGLAKWRNDIRSSSIGRKVVSPHQFTPLIVVNSPVGGYFPADTIGQIDIYPTLLNLAGLENWKWHGMGQSVFDSSRPNYAIATLTGAIVGDTTGVDAAKKSHIEAARRVSDLIIRYDLLKGAGCDSINR